MAAPQTRKRPLVRGLKFFLRWEGRLYSTTGEEVYCSRRKDGGTLCGYRWSARKWHIIPRKDQTSYPELCSPGWFHFYPHLNLYYAIQRAILNAPGYFSPLKWPHMNPRMSVECWIVEAPKDQLSSRVRYSQFEKEGTRKLRLVKRVPKFDTCLPWEKLPAYMRRGNARFERWVTRQWQGAKEVRP